LLLAVGVGVGVAAGVGVVVVVAAPSTLDVAEVELSAATLRVPEEPGMVAAAVEAKAPSDATAPPVMAIVSRFRRRRPRSRVEGEEVFSVGMDPASRPGLQSPWEKPGRLLGVAFRAFTASRHQVLHVR